MGFRDWFRKMGGEIRKPGGYHYHPAGGRAKRVRDDTEVGEGLRHIEAYNETSLILLGWDCDLDGHKTAPVEGTKRTVRCVNCGKTWGDE